MKRFLAAILALAVCGCSAKAPSGQEIQPTWSAPIASDDVPVARDGRLYLRGFHAGSKDEIQLFALEAATGKEVWTAKIPQQTHGNITATSDGRLVLAQVGVFEAATGKKIADTTPLVDSKTDKILAMKKPELGQYFESEACWDGVSYFVDKGRHLHAYDLAKKKDLWTFLVPPAYEWHIQAEPQGLFVIAGNLTALDLKSGKALWSSTLPNKVEFGSLLKPAEPLVLAQAKELVTTKKGGGNTMMPTLVALEAGKELWRFAPVDAIVAVNDTEVLVSGLDSFRNGGANFHAALDRKTGKELWRHDGYISGFVAGGALWQAHHDFHTDFSGSWTGDRRGSKQRGGIELPDSVSTAYLEGIVNGTQSWHSAVYPTTQMQGPTLDKQMLYVCALSQMQGGTSAVHAYRLP